MNLVLLWERERQDVCVFVYMSVFLRERCAEKERGHDEGGWAWGTELETQEWANATNSF